MSSTKFVLACSLLLCISAFSGCASVVSGRHADVTINSNPSAAHFAVHNNEGQVVASGMTPAKVAIKRGNGIFKKPPRYTATIKKPGYQPTRVAIRPKVNPWILGNLAIGAGGVIGLVADSTTGAIWRMSPDTIDQQLAPLQGRFYSQPEPTAGGVSQVSYVSDRLGD